MILKIAFALSLLFGAFLFYHWYEVDEVKTQEEQFESTPSFTAENLKATRYNKNGVPYQELSAQHLEYYQYLSTGYLYRPNITYWVDQDLQNSKINKKLTQQDNSYNDRWNLSADYGILNLNDNVNLRGQVFGFSSNKEYAINEFITEYLEYDLQTKDIRSNEKITLKGRNILNTCNSFTGNLKNQNIRLENNCHANYVIDK